MTTMTTTIETWMTEARAQAAQCWCEKETENCEMDVALAEVVAYKIAAWMNTAAAYGRNAAYWEGRALASEAKDREDVTAPSNNQGTRHRPAKRDDGRT